MKTVVLLTVLLIAGLVASQVLPLAIGDLPPWLATARQFLSMWLLSYLMIQVGREFEVDLENKKQYVIDYAVAATAAAFPWIFCVFYFLAFLMPDANSPDNATWIEALLVARFAAPTSAGVLFSMLSAAGLAGTWTFRKTRILAIFDDLDTVLFMIPLKIMMIGFVWQLGVDLIIVTLLLILAVRYYRKLDIPESWRWVLLYALLVSSLSEAVYAYTKDPSTLIGAHIEVLLPAFLLGCSLKPRPHERMHVSSRDGLGGTHAERRVSIIISSAFMFLVGLSMPAAFGKNAAVNIDMSTVEVVIHVIAVTILLNLGKMFAAFCYRKEATLKERLAVSVSLFPRGEVGAGILAVSLLYGIKAPFVTIAFLSLALNLVLTGFFIIVVKRLLEPAKKNRLSSSSE